LADWQELTQVDQSFATPWGQVKKKPLWFIVVSMLIFPAAILTAASLQPAAFRDRESVWRMYSINVLFLHLTTFLIVCTGWLQGFGRLRFNELGWRMRSLPGAATAIVSCWLFAQVISVGAVVLGVTEAPADRIESGLTTQLARFVANSLGTGCNEETFFRGFLLVQLYARLAGTRNGSKLHLPSFAWAAVVSSFLFAILHFRTNLTDIVQLLTGGIVGAILYARTRNLLVNIGLHGLFNAPMCLNSSDDTTARLSILISTAVVALAWPLMSRWPAAWYRS
jgi:membrane protease YdiL (CAAX protease family)